MPRTSPAIISTSAQASGAPLGASRARKNGLRGASYVVTSICLGSLVLLAACAHAVDLPPRQWEAVPGHEDVLVDTTSIFHFGAAPARDAYHATGPDTLADIRVGKRIVRHVHFWCNDATMLLGDMTVSDMPRVIPMSAARTVVCEN
jgi:hypothetical protein